MTLPSIRPGRKQDLPALSHLFAAGPRSYFYDELGDASEPDLLDGPNAVLIDQRAKRLRGYISLRLAQRSPALPPNASTKVSLRAAAFSSAGHAARLQFRALFCFAQRLLPPCQYGYLFFALTEQRWLQASLKESGFEISDAVRSYECKVREVQQAPQPANLRPAQKTDFASLAAVDAAAFEPLWHMGESDLLALHRDCRFEVAETEGTPIGYTALRLHQDGSARGFSSAQIVRLAVHPNAQNQGVGRQLLVACLGYTRSLDIRRVYLNTQESNARSRRLYESLQFRLRGRPVPVFVKKESVRQTQSARFGISHERQSP